MNKMTVFDLKSNDSERTLQIISYSKDQNIECISRKTGIRGYEIIDDVFFVEETITYENTYGTKAKKDLYIEFKDFSDYYDYLNGDIYKKSCYYQVPDNKFGDYLTKIDLKKIHRNNSFINYSYNDLEFEYDEPTSDDYQLGIKNKLILKEWLNNLNSCDSYAEFKNTVDTYFTTNLSDIVKYKTILFHYALSDISNPTKFDNLMHLLSEHSGNYETCEAFCAIYDPEKVLESVDYSKWPSNIKSYFIQKVNDYIDSTPRIQPEFSKGYYEIALNCYIVEEYFDIHVIVRLFETFDEFVRYLDNDLSGCDLSDDIYNKIDIDHYKTDDETVLPHKLYEECSISIKKHYEGGLFYADYVWTTKNNKIIRTSSLCFKHFCDYIRFLNYDLSDSDFIECDGLLNLSDISKFNLTNIHSSSSFLKKHNLPIKSNTVYSLYNNTNSYEVASINEEHTRELLLNYSREDPFDDQDRLNVNYISDIHLLHRIKNANCVTIDDVIHVIRKIVNNIVAELAAGFLLIGGDVSSDYDIFKLFILELRKQLDDLEWKPRVFFVLGNHELWGDNTSSYNDILNKYKDLVENSGMFLLQNGLFYSNSNGAFIKGNYFLCEQDINTIPTKELKEKLKDAAIIILGGTGFSGLNESFNANNGIYRATLSRTQEIYESEKFKNIYNKVCDASYPNHLIIFTHMPKNDWSNEEYKKGVIYVSGHTHNNQFHDDGEYRIYADNQQGYTNESTHLKLLYVYRPYDSFYDYTDGIYTISNKEYVRHCRAKGLYISFNRPVQCLYMLKKNDYYCFIAQNKEGGLNILNGGSLTKLKHKDINYYYEHMDEVISALKGPLSEYYNYQKTISNAIVSIGGTGRRHGCIIDINYFNHIYVNPIDGTTTAYWASDIIYKRVYPSIPKLLESQCPEIYKNYLKAIDDKKSVSLVSLCQNPTNPGIKMYLDTDIYKASRQISKIQKLNSNILTIWTEPSNKTKKKKLPPKNNDKSHPI